ncbi:hypothetical protein PR001_g27796, partial [Phytophthora rubi]
KIIRHSTSPWASPIVVIIKKNGVDIRLCIDYRLVNGLTKLMIYPTPLINDLLEDLDKLLDAGGPTIQVLARHSTLAWLFRAAGLQGRLGQWAALLSPWTLEITKCTRGEDEILGSLAAAITPRSVVDQALAAIAPRQEPRLGRRTTPSHSRPIPIRRSASCWRSSPKFFQCSVPIVLDRSDEIDGATESVSTESLADPVSPGASAEAAATFQPFAPVSDFVPGLHQSRDISRSDVVPWDSAQIRVLTLDTITPRILISQKVLPPGWLFPKRTGRAGQLDPVLYLPELITERNVTDLYLDDPWKVLDLDSTKPLTFDPDRCPPLATITDEFLALAKDHKQAIWESTHSFPIPRSKQTAEPWAASFYSGLKNRSSHAREKFRAWEDQVFELIRRTGCCDLVILLDRVFLRFPQQSEEATWFPGREALIEEAAPLPRV